MDPTTERHCFRSHFFFERMRIVSEFGLFELNQNKLLLFHLLRIFFSVIDGFLPPRVT